MFAAVENLIYLKIYIPDHDSRLVIWRRTVCVGVQVACSAIVGYSLARSSGGRAAKECREHRLLNSASPHLLDKPCERSGIFRGTSLVCLVVATLLHGTYNFATVVLELGQ